MATLQEYFENDFRPLSVSIDSDYPVTLTRSDGSVSIIQAKRKVKCLPDSSSRFFTYYIPETDLTINIIKFIVGDFESQKRDAVVEVFGSFVDDIAVGTLEAIDSSRIYVYTETALSSAEIASLKELCDARHLHVTVRGKDYVERKIRLEKPVAFISHDSRDKKLIAKRLADGLATRLCFVWYDEYSLKVGDSLRESIEKGIREAKKCIVVVTKNFLENPGWAKKEFDSIFTRELITKESVVLPIWYNVTSLEVYKYSASLPDTKALHRPDPATLSETEYETQIERLISEIHTVLTAE